MSDELEFIDRQRALDLLEKAVAERGEDYVYQTPDLLRSCRYFEDSMPSCVVGHALALHGVQSDDMHSGRNHQTAAMLPEWFSFVSEQAAWVWLAAQRKQDHGSRWGEALQAARDAS